MVEFIITVFTVVFFIYFITFFHELGHVIFALLFTKGEVTMRLGGANDRKEIKIGRINIYINGFKSVYGTVSWSETKLSKVKKIAICIGGPLFSLVLALLISEFIRRDTLNLVNTVGLYAILILATWNFIITILPIKYSRFWGDYEGMKSDGLNIVQILFK